jgi:DNA-binding transcriptional MerR regulator
MNIDTIRQIYDLKKQKEILTTKSDELTKQISSLDEQITALSSSVLQDMKTEKLQEYNIDDLVVTLMAKHSSNINEGALKYLTDNNYMQFVDTKQSIKKNPLNKELKTNTTLKEALSPFMSDVTTEYVVVTTAENTEKMKEHINESKKVSASAIDKQ